MNQYSPIVNVLQAILAHVPFSLFDFIASTDMEKRKLLREKVEAVLGRVHETVGSFQETGKSSIVEGDLLKPFKDFEDIERRERTRIENTFLSVFTELRMRYIQKFLESIDVSDEEKCGRAEASAIVQRLGAISEKKRSERADHDDQHTLIFDILDVFAVGCSYIESEEVISLSLDGIAKTIAHSHITCACLSRKCTYECPQCTQTSEFYMKIIAQSAVKNNTSFKCSCTQCLYMDSLFHTALFPLLTVVSDRAGEPGNFDSFGSKSLTKVVVSLINVLVVAISKSLLHGVLLSASISILYEFAVGWLKSIDELEPKQCPLFSAQRKREKLFAVQETLKLRIYTLQLSTDTVDFKGLEYSLDSMKDKLMSALSDSSDIRMTKADSFFIPTLALSALIQLIADISGSMETALTKSLPGNENQCQKVQDKITLFHILDAFTILNFFCTASDHNEFLGFDQKEVSQKAEPPTDGTYEAFTAEHSYNNLLKYANDLMAISDTSMRIFQDIFLQEFIAHILNRFAVSVQLRVAFQGLYPIHCQAQGNNAILDFLIRHMQPKCSHAYNIVLSNIIPVYLDIVMNQIAVIDFLENVHAKDSCLSSSLQRIYKTKSEAHAKHAKYIELFLLIFVFSALLHPNTPLKKLLCLLHCIDRSFCGATHFSKWGQSEKSGPYTLFFHTVTFFGCDIEGIGFIKHFVGCISESVVLVTKQFIQEYRDTMPPLSTKAHDSCATTKVNISLHFMKLFITSGIQIISRIVDSCQAPVSPFKSGDLQDLYSKKESFCFQVYANWKQKNASDAFLYAFSTKNVADTLEWTAAQIEDQSVDKNLHLEGKISSEIQAEVVSTYLLTLQGTQPNRISEFLSAPSSKSATNICSIFCDRLPTAGEMLMQAQVQKLSKVKSRMQPQVHLPYMLLLDLEHSFRAFLKAIPLPKEGQKIERILEPFCRSWFTKSNALYSLKESSFIAFADYFPNADAVYLLVFSILMLNTQIHNRSLSIGGRKINALYSDITIDDASFLDFYGVLQGIDGIRRFEKMAMFDVYRRVKLAAFQGRDPDDIGLDRSLIFGTLDSSEPNLPCYARMYGAYASDIALLTKHNVSKMITKLQSNESVWENCAFSDISPSSSCFISNSPLMVYMHELHTFSKDNHEIFTFPVQDTTESISCNQNRGLGINEIQRTILNIYGNSFTSTYDRTQSFDKLLRSFDDISTDTSAPKRIEMLASDALKGVSRIDSHILNEVISGCRGILSIALFTVLKEFSKIELGEAASDGIVKAAIALLQTISIHS